MCHRKPWSPEVLWGWSVNLGNIKYTSVSNALKSQLRRLIHFPSCGISLPLTSL
jgi:hypothetical protein